MGAGTLTGIGVLWYVVDNYALHTTVTDSRVLEGLPKCTIQYFNVYVYDKETSKKLREKSIIVETNAYGRGYANSTFKIRRKYLKRRLGVRYDNVVELPGVLS